MIRPLFILIVIVLTISCKEDNSNFDGRSQEEIELLTSLLEEKESFISMLTQELDEINDDLNAIQITTDTNSIIDPTEKIALYDSLLTQSNERVDKLENLLSTSNTSNDVKLLKSVIRDLNARITEKEKLIASLQIENDSLKTENTELISEVSTLENEYDILLRDVDKKKRELDSIQEEVIKQQEISEKEKKRLAVEVKELKEQIQQKQAEVYFDLAYETLSEAEEIKLGWFSGKRKKIKGDLIEIAYENFRQACLLGHPDAAMYISKILYQEDYNQYISIDRSSSRLGKCGI